MCECQGYLPEYSPDTSLIGIYCLPELDFESLGVFFFFLVHITVTSLENPPFHVPYLWTDTVR